MAFDPASAALDRLQLDACGLYCALAHIASASKAGDPEKEPTLGGKLLYAGELDSHGRAVVIAGNVAGCATLTSSAEVPAQKLAIRDGVVDFVVTSLDEALRILKNEVRKCAAVAVCVSAAPTCVEREMIERGVLPDLLFEGTHDGRRDAPEFGPRTSIVELTAPDAGLAFVTWQVTQAPARWMPRLDEIAQDCLRSDLSARRWIRLSPHYGGRGAQSRRVVFCETDAAKLIVSRFAAQAQDGGIETEVLASLSIGGETEVFRWAPVRT